MKTIDELGISPTPWKADVYNGDCVYYGDGDFLAKFVPSLSDVRLIAAAPELYKALEECERKLDAIEPYGNLLEKVRSALANASGEEAK